jgi:hypothetical protein
MAKIAFTKTQLRLGSRFSDFIRLNFNMSTASELGPTHKRTCPGGGL